MGQWAGAVRIVRPLARGRPYLRLSPITGAGLDPWVWTLGSVTLLVRPLESLPAALTVKGAGGEETAGTDTDVGDVVVRVVAVPHGRSAVVGIVDPGTAAQQLTDPPSRPAYAQRRAKGRGRSINRGAFGARGGMLLSTTASAIDSSAGHQLLRPTAKPADSQG
jgi:hypothetical protein